MSKAFTIFTDKGWVRKWDIIKPSKHSKELIVVHTESDYLSDTITVYPYTKYKYKWIQWLWLKWLKIRIYFKIIKV